MKQNKEFNKFTKITLNKVCKGLQNKPGIHASRLLRKTKKAIKT